MKALSHARPDASRPAPRSLSRMTWPEFAEALQGLNWALVPVGSTKEHGDAGKYGVASLRAEQFCLVVAQRLYPRALVLPPLRYGLRFSGGSRPGGLGLSVDAFISWCSGICGSLYYHGLRRLVLVSADDANLAPLGILCNRFRRDHPECRLAWVSLNQLARLDGTAGKAADPAAPPGIGLPQRTTSGPELEDQIAQYWWLAKHATPHAGPGRTPGSECKDDRGAMMIEAAVERLLRFLEGW